MKTYERQTIRSSQTGNPVAPKGKTGQTKPYSEAFKTAGTGLEGHGTLRGWCPLHPNEAPPITKSMVIKALLLGSLLFIVGYIMLVGLALAFGM